MGNWSETDTIELLFKKYSLLKSEIHLWMTSYRSHVKNMQFVVSSLIAGTGYLIVDNKYPPTNDRMFVWISGIFVAVNVVFYLVYSVYDSIYHQMVIGERMATLESNINDLAHKNLLIWESNQHIREIETGLHPLQGVWQPSWALQMHVFALLGLSIVGDLSPFSHPGASRICSIFEPVGLGGATVLGDSVSAPSRCMPEALSVA